MKADLCGCQEASRQWVERSQVKCIVDRLWLVQNDRRVLRKPLGRQIRPSNYDYVALHQCQWGMNLCDRPKQSVVDAVAVAVGRQNSSLVCGPARRTKRSRIECNDGDDRYT